MDSKPAQNIQDTFLNTVRKDKSPITIYLVSGVKLTGKIRSFDKYSVLLENNSQEQLIFKHAISTVVSGRPEVISKRARTERTPAQQPMRIPQRRTPDLVSRKPGVHDPDSLPELAVNAERAVLVAVEFTGERRRLTKAARLARSSAAVLAAGPDADALDDLLEGSAGRSDLEDEIAEFQELARSAGADVVTTVVQRRPRPDAATLVGEGKLEEIAGIVASTGADLLLFDHDLTPSQLRNLDKRFDCRVIDRTQLILDIFARHARTREGQLQVELAQLEYQLPRLSGQGKAMSQLGGGIGTRGPGETKLETDRRKINLRIDHVKEQLESVRRIRRQQRQRREAVPVPVVALVGYTNAGKSTLFNALTQPSDGIGVLESAKMFATLDPKLRQMMLPSRRKILLSDTVGFIRNLPHTLVTSFRATLEEVERAEILLHVRDMSSVTADEQKAEVEKVLGELDVAQKPVIEVLNKVDRMPAEQKERLRTGEMAVAVSGRTGEGLDDLLAAIDRALVVDPLVEANFRVPQSEGAAMAALEGGAVVSGKRFEGNLAYFSARGPASLLGRYRRFREREMNRLER